MSRTEQPASLVHTAVEPCESNRDSFALTLYYEGDEYPTEEQVRADCANASGFPGKVDTTSPFFSYKAEPNALSGYAGLYRFQATPYA